MKTYSYTVQMHGFLPVTGTHRATRSWDAQVAAVKHFADANAIELQTDPNLPGFTSWHELVRFYAPAVAYSSAR